MTPEKKKELQAVPKNCSKKAMNFGAIAGTSSFVAYRYEYMYIYSRMYV